MGRRGLRVWGGADGDTNQVQVLIQEDPFCVRIVGDGSMHDDPSHGLYDISEHYQVTRGILEAPERYWKHFQG